MSRSPDIASFSLAQLSAASESDVPDRSTASMESRETASGEIDDLKRRIAELELAVRARDDFLTIAAHELRNPMTPILGQVERLSRMAASGATQPIEIRNIARRIEQLVRLFVKRATTLLDVSRISSGKLNLHIETFDINRLITRVVKAHQPAVEHAGSKVIYAEGQPVTVALDQLAVEQILDNILLNALRYGCRRPVEVTLGYSEDAIWIVVSDRGMGISSEDQARIFHRFEQAVAMAPHGGFGVGLWVVGRLVQAMAGDIKVDSVVNRGTAFTVTLPRYIGQPT